MIKIPNNSTHNNFYLTKRKKYPHLIIKNNYLEKGNNSQKIRETKNKTISQTKYFQSYTLNSTNDSIISTSRTNKTKHIIIQNKNSLTPLNIRKKIIELDEKIQIAQENKKILLNKKNKMFIEKYKLKEKRFNEIKEDSQKKKLFKLNQIKKLNNMRRLKLKIHNFFQRKNNICNNFETKNSNFNMKILDYFSGNHNLNQTIKYQSNFRFDKFYNGEAHDRSKMIFDINLIKNNGEIEKNLENELTEEEKKLIIEDLAYFFQDNKYKQKTLAQRINQEDGIDSDKNTAIFQIKDDKKINKNNLTKKLINNDIYHQLNIIKDDLNKTTYKIKTKNLRVKKNSEKKKNEIIKNMIESLRLNYTRNISSEKEKREKMFKEHYKYRKKINFNLTNKSFDDNYFDIETELINNNSFKKDELKLIQMYNKKIRDGFLFRKLNK